MRHPEVNSGRCRAPRDPRKGPRLHYFGVIPNGSLGRKAQVIAKNLSERSLTFVRDDNGGGSRYAVTGGCCLGGPAGCANAGASFTALSARTFRAISTPPALSPRLNWR